ncbi:MAG TPA: lysophospholipid transporter LplT [Ottowia sp.]|uniref:lysophospholipid transporter LplT n=1 Tax=Ottowia sp. TaxID=1898956 RepID=UPI002C009DC9|nr:lysophospholipid transporter LplT [Ottowia sp.]HRQ03280.1 lysophospholipid transporter LplT [Ottowia sp.]
MTPGIGYLIAAQFVSGLADNALLIIAIARLSELGQSAWLAPLLKAVFTLAYVLLAPVVGALADRWPKAWVMLGANGVKGLGCALMALALDPLLAFALAGVGAAVYSPAKYGLVTELSPPAQLVQANGWLEVTTVGAIILGTALGGVLVGPLLQLDAARQLGRQLPVDTALGAAILVVLVLYVLAGALNLLIPASGVRAHAIQPSLRALLLRFGQAQRTLWQDTLGGVSLGVTTLFWGAGATLQFVVLAWAQQNLGFSLSGAAYLQGLVAVGIGIGALMAGRWVALQQAPQVLPLGVLMGLAVPLLTLVHGVGVAAPLLATVGALAGFFVVPMNALLQHRGQQLLGTGESIAVQNFNENLCVLLMLGAYAALQAAGWPLVALVFTLGGFTAVGVALVMRRYRRSPQNLVLLKEKQP